MYKIIRDTREQYPWDFTFYDNCDEVIIRKLETGDYTLEGYEDILVIERKRNTGEIANNIGFAKTRFNAELERMKKIKWHYIICEFSIDDVLAFPVNSGIPKNKWSNLRINGKYMMKTLSSYKELYGIDVIYCENEFGAYQKATEIFDNVYATFGKRKI